MYFQLRLPSGEANARTAKDPHLKFKMTSSYRNPHLLKDPRPHTTAKSDYISIPTPHSSHVGTTHPILWLYTHILVQNRTSWALHKKIYAEAFEISLLSRGSQQPVQALFSTALTVIDESQITQKAVKNLAQTTICIVLHSPLKTNTKFRHKCSKSNKYCWEYS